MRRFTKPIRRRSQRPRKCLFCEQKLEPDYKEVETLRHYISERGKIISRANTGVCQKHQRRLMQAIKRARFLAFLPFIVRPS